MLKFSVQCLLITTLVFLLACGKSSEEKAMEKAVEKAIERESGGKVKADISRDKIEIKGEEGSVSIASEGKVDIPDDFPKDIHLYKGARVVMSARENQGFMLLLETGDEPKKVGEIYKSEMTSQGWKEKMVMNVPEGVMLQYTNCLLY
ncbi:MAG: hypothetical protein N2246_10990, partial [Candidatus Sumerlaeia bacterium]|nr:hypothetical protein [Candidatus Sumerlaeia bacterium]